VSFVWECRKRSKWLPKINEWVTAHGGGIIIPFSVEFEQRLWDLREDPVSRLSSLKSTLI
jgi:hypothetical protein